MTALVIGIVGLLIVALLWGELLDRVLMPGTAEQRPYVTAETLHRRLFQRTL